MQRKIDILWAYNLYMEEYKLSSSKAAIIAAAFTRAEMEEWN